MAKVARLDRLLGRAVDVRPGEGRALLLAFGYFFFVLATYYVLRPVRDEMGVRSGVRNLPWLFTGTFLVSLAIAPLYAGLVARLERRRFIPLIYGFLTLNILAFWAVLTANVATGVAAMTFFVWLSVFNVFAVSVFWSFMADLFASEQAKRLYPTIAAGGSIGGFAGSATVTSLAKLVGPANLLLIAAGLLVLVLACAMALDRVARRGEGVAAPVAREKAAEGERRVGGSWVEGLVVIFRSPYLAGIALWVFALSLAGTFAYNMQADIVGRAGLDSGARTQIFGAVDLAANLLQPIVQILITRMILQRLGVGITLSIVTVVFCVGFLAMGASPVLTVLVAFMTAQRTAQFAISNPAREALFTVVSREDKYKAKNVIDNAVFRGADVANAWLFNLLHSGMGFGLSTIAFIGAPVAAAWFALSLGLGRTQARRTADQQAALAAAPSAQAQPAGA